MDKKFIKKVLNKCLKDTSLIAYWNHESVFDVGYTKEDLKNQENIIKAIKELDKE